MPANTNDDKEEITVEVDEWTARRLKQLAWEHESTAEGVARQCCRYGAHEYERALDIA